MLGLTKMGVMDRLQEKSVNSTVNAWIRGPGCMFFDIFYYYSHFFMFFFSVCTDVN